jgi:hypothetical protein
VNPPGVSQDVNPLEFNDCEYEKPCYNPARLEKYLLPVKQKNTPIAARPDVGIHTGRYAFWEVIPKLT